MSVYWELWIFYVSFVYHPAIPDIRSGVIGYTYPL